MTRGHPDVAWALLEDMKERGIAPSAELLPVLGDLGKEGGGGGEVPRAAETRRMIGEMVKSGAVRAADAEAWMPPLASS